MSRQPSKRKASSPVERPAGQEQARGATTAITTIPWLLLGVGLGCLGLAGVMSGMLVLDHLGGLSLPGCGPGSPCAQAAASVWGKAPYINWPVSFVGFAYFVGAIIAWAGSRRGVAPSFRNIARLGALVSYFYVLVIIFGGYRCNYCLAAHAGNLGFWLVIERARRSSLPSLRPVVTVVAAFVLTSLVLAGAEWRQKRIVADKQEQDLAESTAAIIASDAQKAAVTQEQPTQTASPAATNAAQSATTQPAVASGQSGEQRWPNGLTGRWRWGPEKAPVRIVMLTDYQCTDCNRIEKEVRPMLEQRKDVSLSIKHFPMCADCNDGFKNNNIHPNACWAARAAEAAGILRGNDGFWQMHNWLFDIDGNFTNEQFNEGIRKLGYDPQEFIAVMTGEETLRRVKQDIEEGIVLGLFYTPMVFINGKELRGVLAQNAIPRAVAAVAAQNPPAMGPEHDQPDLAPEKYMGDWREQFVRQMPPDSHPWSRGPDRPRLDIVVWGDYQESNTARADAIIRECVRGREDARYSLRHYPFDQSCNPNVSRTLFPSGCRASQAAEAAGVLGGVEGYWRMHEWLMANQKQFSDEALRQAAPALGLDAAALFEAMQRPEVQQAIREDVAAGKPMIPKGIPTIYIDGKWVPRFHLEGHEILKRIIEEAGRE